MCDCSPLKDLKNEQPEDLRRISWSHMNSYKGGLEPTSGEIITLFYLLLFVFVCFDTRCHSPSLIVIFCYSLSFVITRCQSLSFIFTCCTTRCHSLHHSLSLVVIRCTNRCHALYLDVPLVCLFINDQLVYKVTDEWYIEWQKMITIDNEWHRVV